MPFPETKRVVFNNNPLDRVICQMRFPPILSIDTDIPARFQEQIRSQYPFYKMKSEIEFNIPDDIKPSFPSELLELPAGSAKNHEFISKDEHWKINLTNSFLALSTSNYSRWEEYIGHLELPLNLLIEVYNPEFFTRVGLRYIDIFRRSTLGLEEEAWSCLINPSLLAVLGDTKLAKNVKNISHTTEIQLADGVSRVRITDGFVEAIDTGELSYKIDSDFFTEERIDLANVIDQLNYFNLRGSRLIQWCINDLLYNAMEPKEI